MSVIPKSENFGGISAIVHSRAMVRLLETAHRIAKSNVSVLITGETGTGKEVIARAIHHYSLRCHQPWVDVNCAAWPDHLVESELFGYEKGAFSGAESQKPGFFELAQNGTLFLDEVGELESRTQVKLLRVLDGTPYYRVGGLKKVAADVRIIAATNRDLEARVGAGEFRSDLFHRLNQIHLRVPPLRERKEDILPLANHFLHEMYPHANFSEEAKQTLENYHWSGNVRELRNVVTTCAILAMSEVITVHELPAHIQESRPGLQLSSSSTPLGKVEKDLIFETLRGTSGHQQKAARVLGISRRTLSRKLRSYSLQKA